MARGCGRAWCPAWEGAALLGSGVGPGDIFGEDAHSGAWEEGEQRRCGEGWPEAPPPQQARSWLRGRAGWVLSRGGAQPGDTTWPVGCQGAGQTPWSGDRTAASGPGKEEGRDPGPRAAQLWEQTGSRCRPRGWWPDLSGRAPWGPVLSHGGPLTTLLLTNVRRSLLLLQLRPGPAQPGHGRRFSGPGMRCRGPRRSGGNRRPRPCWPMGDPTCRCVAPGLEPRPGCVRAARNRAQVRGRTGWQLSEGRAQAGALGPRAACPGCAGSPVLRVCGHGVPHVADALSKGGSAEGSAGSRAQGLIPTVPWGRSHWQAG